MRRPVRITVGLAGASLVAGAVALLVSSPPLDSHDAAAPVESVQPAAALPVTSTRGFLGVLVAGESVDVAARTDGVLTDVRVRLGDRVAQDGVVATIDDQPLRDDLAMARATLAAAQAEERRARIELTEAQERRQRWDSIGGDSGTAVVSKEELAALRYKEQYATQQLATVTARVAEAVARVRSLERRIGEAVIRAPFDGEVATRYVDVGATIRAGQPIVRLVRAGQLRARFAIPEEDGAAARMGTPVLVRVEAVDTSLRGVIENVAPEVDATSRMIFAEARIDAPEALAGVPLAGRVVRVHLDVGGRGEREQAAVPTAPAP